MADRLKVFHLKSAGDKNLPLPNGYWHLATCLRSIIVTDQEGFPDSLKKHDFMKGEVAYEFLLRVICGLDSPLLGETEILGQFKEFLKSNQNSFSGPIQQVLNNLTRDAKKIRSQFLQNLGCTSYGSLLRKELRGRKFQLSILGAGSLAQDIFPWFAKTGNKVRVITRNPSKYNNLLEDHENIELHSFENLSEHKSSGVLVIAAPLKAQWIQDNLDLSQFDMIFDLRGDSHSDKIQSRNVTSLKSLFDSIEMNKRQAAQTKEKAMSAIKEQANHLLLQERPRPFGWDDLWTYS